MPKLRNGNNGVRTRALSIASPAFYQLSYSAPFSHCSSQRFRGLPIGRCSSGWITSAFLWRAIDAILLTCDHHLIVLLVEVALLVAFYSLSNFVVPDLIHSGLTCSFFERDHLCCCQHLRIADVVITGNQPPTSTR